MTNYNCHKSEQFNLGTIAAGLRIVAAADYYIIIISSSSSIRDGTE